MNKGDFEEACFYDKIGIIPKENETLDNFIKRSFLTLDYSRYEELNERRDHPEVSSELFFKAVEEIKDLVDMNLYWVDARYKDLNKEGFVGKCIGVPLTKKDIEIYVPFIYIHKAYSNSLLTEEGKSVLRHELVHAGRHSFNFDKLKDDKRSDEYLVKWLGNDFGGDCYNLKTFLEEYKGHEKQLPSKLNYKSMIVDTVRKKLKMGCGRENSFYIISRLLDKEMELVAKENDVKNFVRSYSGLKWKIIRKKVFG